MEILAPFEGSDKEKVKGELETSSDHGRESAPTETQVETQVESPSQTETQTEPQPETQREREPSSESELEVERLSGNDGSDTVSDVDFRACEIMIQYPLNERLSGTKLDEIRNVLSSFSETAMSQLDPVLREEFVDYISEMTKKIRSLNESVDSDSPTTVALSTNHRPDRNNGNELAKNHDQDYLDKLNESDLEALWILRSYDLKKIANSSKKLMEVHNLVSNLHSSEHTLSELVHSKYKKFTDAFWVIWDAAEAVEAVEAVESESQLESESLPQQSQHQDQDQEEEDFVSDYEASLSNESDLYTEDGLDESSQDTYIQEVRNRQPNFSVDRNGKPVNLSSKLRVASVAAVRRDEVAPGKRARVPWVQEEEDALIEGITTYKGPYWKEILKDRRFAHILRLRNNVDLKDKFVTLKRSGKMDFDDMSASLERYKANHTPKSGREVLTRQREKRRRLS
jgi:hypothetical protein